MLSSHTDMTSIKDVGSAQRRSTSFLKVSHKTNANGNASSSFEAWLETVIRLVGEDKKLPPITRLKAYIIYYVSKSPTPRAVVRDDDARENVHGNSRHLTGDTRCPGCVSSKHWNMAFLKASHGEMYTMYVVLLH